MEAGSGRRLEERDIQRRKGGAWLLQLVPFPVPFFSDLVELRGKLRRDRGARGWKANGSARETVEERETTGRTADERGRKGLKTRKWESE